jgi:alanine racemase
LQWTAFTADHDAVMEHYRCWAEVDLDALRENLARIKTLAGPAKKIITVVKADAYGHGLKQIAAALMQSGTDIFGVANLAEAQAIRSVGRGWPILMLGACLPFEVDCAVRDDVMPTISTLREAEMFSASAVRQHRNSVIHLKLDTGMGRLGAAPDQAEALLEAIERLPALLVRGLYTHYSSVEDDEEFTRRQRHSFLDFVDRQKKKGRHFDWLHAGNSGGVLLESDDICTTIRPGLLVYGVIPPARRPLDPLLCAQFRPALSWKCRVSLIRDIPSGTPISYGRTFTSRRAMRIATITAGYGDGYSRAASGRGEVLIRDRRCPVLGRVTMDQMVADVSQLAEVQPGDEVILIGACEGERITANELANWSATVAWKVLTNITYRVPRIYRGGHAA